MYFHEKDKPTNKKSINVTLKKQQNRCFITFFSFISVNKFIPFI